MAKTKKIKWKDGNEAIDISLDANQLYTGKGRVRRLQVSIIKDAFGKKTGYCASVHDENKPVFEKCGIKTKKQAWEKLKKYKK